MAAKMALDLSRILQAQERFRSRHPLSKFAVNGKVSDGPCAAAVLKYVQDLACTEPESGQHGAAEWFLFKSERAFFFACSEAGIDAEKLRGHLKQWQQLGPEERSRSCIVPQAA
jgi:hypothetical protein